MAVPADPLPKKHPQHRRPTLGLSGIHKHGCVCTAQAREDLVNIRSAEGQDRRTSRPRQRQHNDLDTSHDGDYRSVGERGFSSLLSGGWLDRPYLTYK